MGDRPIRLLCIGLQNYWLDHWVARPEVRVVGIVGHYEECDAEEGQRFAENMGARLYSSIESALNDAQPDMVTMVTPSDRKTDVRDVERVVRRGFDLYLEKYRPADRHDWRNLLELSRSTGRQIGMGEPYRYDRVVQRAKQAVEAGLLGPVEQIVWRCHRPLSDDDWMSAYRHVMLEDLSYHHFGVIHHLLGLERFRQVFAASLLPSWTPVPSPSVVSLLAEGEAGMHLHYYSSWAAHGRATSWLGEFLLEGREGMLELREGSLRLVDRKGNERTIDTKEPLAYPLRAGIVDEYIRARLEQRRTNLDVERFYPVIRFIYAALESAEQGVAVGLPG